MSTPLKIGQMVHAPQSGRGVIIDLALTPFANVELAFEYGTQWIPANIVRDWREAGTVGPTEVVTMAAHARQVQLGSEMAREVEAAQFRAEVVRLRGDGMYAHLTQVPESLGNRNVAAQNMKTELRRAFKGTKFSVTNGRGSGVHSVYVRWEGGPSVKEVDAIVGKYQSKGFDGMTDCAYYIKSAWTEVFGAAGYVFTSRENTEAEIEAKLTGAHS